MHLDVKYFKKILKKAYTERFNVKTATVLNVWTFLGSIEAVCVIMERKKNS